MKNLISLTFTVLSFLPLFSQITVSGNFSKQEIQITITPETPAYCPSSGTNEILVTCNESFESYLWTHLETNRIIGPSATPEARLDLSGVWRLTVTSNYNNNLCLKSIEFEVHELSNSENIKRFFEEAGFIGIPIFRSNPPGINTGENNRQECILSEISFAAGSGDQIKLESIFSTVYDEFIPFKEISSGISGILTESNSEGNQSCLCDLNIEILQNDFTNSATNIWAHQYFESNTASGGILFLKGRMPGDAKLPADNAHRQRYLELLPQILDINNNPNTTDQAIILFKGLFLAHPIGEFKNTSLCSTSLSVSENYVSPAGVAIKPNNPNLIGYFSSPSNNAAVDHGTLTWFEKASTNAAPAEEFYHAFQYQNNVFQGYINPISGEFSGYFEAQQPNEQMELTSVLECSGYCKNIYTQSPKLKFKEDGGINFIIVRLVINPNAKSNTLNTDKVFTYCIPEGLKSNNNVVSFLTPTKSIISLPCTDPTCNEIVSIEMTYGAFDEEQKFSSGLVSGLLYEFTLRLNGVNSTYKWNPDNLSYTNVVSGFAYTSTQNNSSEFVYSLVCGQKHNLYKFANNGGLNIHQNNAGYDYNYNNDFFTFSKTFIPFTQSFPLIGNGTELLTFNNCLHCPGMFSELMTAEGCETPQHIYLDQISQLATVYPEYFDYEYFTFGEYEENIFSYNNSDWDTPVRVIGAHNEEKELVFWEEQLNSDPALKDLYASNKHEYYRIYYFYLSEFLTTKYQFWNLITPENISTVSFTEIENHLKYEPQHITNTIDFSQKKLILNKYFNDPNYLNTIFSYKGQNVITHLIASNILPSHVNDALLYIEQIGIKTLWEKFDINYFTDHHTRAILAIIGLINKRDIQEYYEEIDQYIPTETSEFASKKPPIVEADILNWSNLTATFPASEQNKILIEDFTDPLDYKTIVPVLIEGNINFDGKTLKDNSVINMPILQAALIAKINTNTAIENTGWVALDLGLLALGIGAARYGWATANYVKRIITVGDIVGGTLGVTSQLISSKYISPEHKQYLQIGSFIASAPLLLTELAQLKKLIKKNDEIIETTTGIPDDDVLAINKCSDDIIENYYKNNIENAYPTLNTNLKTLSVETQKILKKDILLRTGNDLLDFLSTPNGIKAWEAMISKAYRTDISLLQRMSDDIIAEPTFYTWIKNNASKLDGWKVWMGTYNSLGDPVKNILGSGRVNHATEWNQLINEIEAAGGEVIFRPGTIAYSPGIKKGVPGQLIIDQDASITALRHEHRHFLDDQAAGYKGFEGIFDPNFRITTEYNAYKLEVVAMKDLGHTNVANQLKTNFQQEVNDIMSKMGTPNQTILNLIDELVNL